MPKFKKGQLIRMQREPTSTFAVDHGLRKGDLGYVMEVFEESCHMKVLFYRCPQITNDPAGSTWNCIWDGWEIVREPDDADG